MNPDCHEAGITEPAQRFLEPMVVDIRRTPGAANYYFYQAHSGQVIFCITPDPPLIGTDRRETSEFLPMVARRMVGLMPKLANLKVRRTWRGLYPMTPMARPSSAGARRWRAISTPSACAGRATCSAPVWAPSFPGS